MLVGGWLYLFHVSAFLISRTPSTVYKLPRNFNIQSQNTFIVVKLNACTASLLHYFRAITVYFIITKIFAHHHLLYAATAVLICLVNLSLKEVYSSLIQSLRSSYILRGVYDVCHEWCCYIKPPFKYLCFTSSLEKTVKSHNFGVICPM